MATWGSFVEEFQRNYFPAYAEEETHDELKSLKQKGGVRDYIKRLSELLLQIPSMNEVEAFHQFMGSLKPWTKQELKWYNVGNLTTAMTVAELLVEYKASPSTSRPDTCPRDKGTSGGDRGRYNRPIGGRPPPAGPHPHWAHARPNGGGQRKIKAKKAKEPKGLMFADVKIGVTTMSALVDMGASDIFISKEAAKKLNLRVEKGAGWLKMVNSKEVPAIRVVRDVELQLGSWKGKETLENCQFMIPVHHESDRDRKMISAIRLTKGTRKGEVTFLAALKIEDNKGEGKEVPTEATQVLDSFKDVMLSELPKKLPPKRGVDHRIELLTVKNKYPIPLIADLVDQLGGAQWFTKLDLRSGYYQVWIAEGNEPKIARVMRYGSYKFLMMLFGLANALATFCTMMNKVLHPFLDRFVVAYLDDIMVYSRTLEEHVKHLRQVFQVLRENELYVKREKCAFAQEKVSFLGHIVGCGQVRMDKAKIQSIIEWELPTEVLALRSFLGLTNFYRRFIRSYSSITVPLTDLLKKENVWEWTDRCQRVFDQLKQAMTEEPVLALPDHTKPYKDGHPVAFESRKLNNIERRYTIQEKEMTAVVHCLRTWRHYILGSKFVVRMDNVATSYFQTQKKLSPKQARWQDFLAKFDYALEYKPRKANSMEDALSRKMELMSHTVSRLSCPWVDRIKEGLTHDPKAQALIGYAKEGIRRTLALIKDRYYWPQMRDDMEAYVKTCLVLKVCNLCAYDKGLPGRGGSQTVYEAHGEVLRSATNDRERSRSPLHETFLVQVVQAVGVGAEHFNEFASPNRRLDGAGQCSLKDLPPTQCEHDASQLGEVDRRNPVLLQLATERVDRPEFVQGCNWAATEHPEHNCFGLLGE
ncbi:uncharacterized protein LOC120291836 [Eucalyptus grandis]|uniref:uncharacterized protein LOC120291836 n=1 Tax=Eucalyptus grandis TaxID=71139 RepID=UPI00192EC728|nr:uncharacterized protein LOC120291836 [Eucalyptus grandis]